MKLADQKKQCFELAQENYWAIGLEVQIIRTREVILGTFIKLGWIRSG
jgi:hypothetical protein